MWTPCWKGRRNRNSSGSGATTWSNGDWALFTVFAKPLGAWLSGWYNGTRNGGADCDEIRSNQRVFQKECVARGGGGFAVLHFQIRLHKRWCHRLCMAVHTLRSAFWHPTDVRLDRTGRLFGNRPSAVPAELYYWWSDWRFRPGLAAVGCSMVYIPHYLPDKCRMHTMI